MNRGLHNILKKIADSPEDSKLEDRYLILVKDLEPVEKTDALLDLSHLIVEKNPKKALKIARQVTSKDAAHSKKRAAKIIKLAIVNLDKDADQKKSEAKQKVVKKENTRVTRSQEFNKKDGSHTSTVSRAQKSAHVAKDEVKPQFTGSSEDVLNTGMTTALEGFTEELDISKSMIANVPNQVEKESAVPTDLELREVPSMVGRTDEAIKSVKKSKAPVKEIDVEYKPVAIDKTIVGDFQVNVESKVHAMKSAFQSDDLPSDVQKILAKTEVMEPQKSASTFVAQEATSTKSKKIIREPLEEEVIAAEKLAAEKLAAEKLAAEKLAAEKLAAEKLAAEQLAAEKLAAEKLAAEKLAAEKIAAEKLEAENIAAEKLEAEKLAAEQLAAEKLAAEKLEAEKQRIKYKSQDEEQKIEAMQDVVAANNLYLDDIQIKEVVRMKIEYQKNWNIDQVLETLESLNWEPEFIEGLIEELWGPHIDQDLRKIIEKANANNTSPKLWGVYLDIMLEELSPRSVLMEIQRKIKEDDSQEWCVVAYKYLKVVTKTLHLQPIEWTPEVGSEYLKKVLEQRLAPGVLATAV